MIERWVRAGRLSWSAVGVAALLAIFGVVLWSVRVVFPPLILAGAIVFILNPLVTRMQHRGIPRAVGAAISYLVLIALLVGAGFLVGPLASDQSKQLRQDWPAIQDRAERWIDSVAEDTKGTFYEFSRRDLEDAVDGGDQSFTEQLRRLRKIGTAVFHVLLILVLAPIIAFYL
ncbi:MAG TPA: AI-2E family transporter, partial [Acidimicrobiales bacterium]|nr:AI-2E family transporter [Acidimicrobiales bacterium]